MKNISTIIYSLLTIIVAVIYIYITDVVIDGEKFPIDLLVPSILGTLLIPFLVSIGVYFLFSNFSKLKNIKFSLIFLIFTLLFTITSSYGQWKTKTIYDEFYGLVASEKRIVIE